ncbi:MAG: DNA-directed RNA polymerase subunit alpha [Bacteroidales bacterium]|jgi:DNA-directed RNA polymerase subunit alpha|nr:DNA-directed RNA polymerase subunit alpha [Bacteroidales bacterium]
MAILTFQKPDRVIMTESDDFCGVFEFRPLQKGYGVTVGNALRRVLVNSIEGYAISSLKINGVHQEFSSIPGVMEDVTDIVLNLKQVRFKNKIEGNDFEKATIIINGQETFTAGDMNKYFNFFQILNPKLLICRMEPNVKLVMEITVEKGRGYISGEENRLVHDGIDVIAVDSIFTPIKNVKYSVDDYRVEQTTDFEKLVLSIETDGSIHPKEALKAAAKILIEHFALFTDENFSTTLPEQKMQEDDLEDDLNEDDLIVRRLLKSRLEDMGLSVRAINCLKSAELDTFGDLVAIRRADLLKFRNFGKKSLSELEELVKSKNLEFGMNVAKYKLDND